jgi:uncharacterized membrane protein
MKLLRGLLAVAYPFLIFAGLRWLEPRWLALLLGVSLLLRSATRWQRPSRQELQRLLAPALLVAAVLVPTLVLNDARYLLFVPVLVNAALLLAFARTLRRGPTLVETFARLQHPDLSEAQVRHCRTVTVVWCVFFAANAAVCLWLALAADLWIWTLYTGLVSYGLVGLVFAAEFVVRSWRFRNYQGTLVEPLFRRLFPQGPTP